MKDKNKGFTLVELLAVIVVLAIIMIIAVPSVLSSMDNARKNTFVIEARKILNSAMAKRQSNELTGNINAGATSVSIKMNGATTAVSYYCYTLSGIGVDAGGRYHGVVLYNPTNQTWYLKMSDGTNMTSGTNVTSTSKNGLSGFKTLEELNTSSNVVANTVATATIAGLDLCTF